MKLDSTRKYSLIFSALLIGYKYLGLVIEGKVPYTEISISSSSNITVILSILSVFFIVNHIYYWFIEEKGKRSKFEFFSTVTIGLIAIIPVGYSYLCEFGINWKVLLSTGLLLLLGSLLGTAIDFIFAIFLSIRSNDEMKKMGLSKIPSASKAFIRSLFFLIPINLIIIFLIFKYEHKLPHLIQEYWYLFYLSPTILMNFDYFVNFLKCLGPKKMRIKAINDLKRFRKAMDMHEMHYQYRGIEPFRNYEKPPICNFAQIGDMESVRQLLNQGEDPNVQDPRGWTPLMWSSAEQHIEIVELLLDYGADPDLINYLGRLAIGYAANYGNYEICEKLIEHGAVLNPTSEFVDNRPLHLAASKGHLEVVKLLVENGADVFYKSKGDLLAIEIAMKEKHGEIAKFLRTKMAELADGSEDKTDFIKNTDWLKYEKE